MLCERVPWYASPALQYINGSVVAVLAYLIECLLSTFLSRTTCQRHIGFRRLSEEVCGLFEQGFVFLKET